MLHTDFLCEFLAKCKANGIHTAVDTAGDVPFESFEKVLPYTDLFLYDIKAITDELHREGTGASNKRILENLERLAKVGADIIVRIPVIGGFNADENELLKIKALLDSFGIKKVELLPYHAMGEHKYSALSMNATEYEEPSSEDMEKFRAIFK